METTNQFQKIANYAVKQLEETIVGLLKNEGKELNGQEIGRHLNINLSNHVDPTKQVGHFQGCLLRNLEREGILVCREQGGENFWSIKNQ